MNDVEKIIAQLEKKRAGIDRAIAALREVSDSGSDRRSELAARQAAPRKRRLSAAGRKRIAEAARKRWAAQRASTANQPPGASKQASRRKSATKKKRARPKRTPAKTSAQETL